MREKTRKLILSIFLAACIVALMAASLSYTLTNGRYTGGELSEDSPYEEIIDFVGATKYTVSTPEELVNAIENGYSYIEIAEDAPDPFVINNNIADVATNLVLNVNGHSLVRNSRNPLINVQKNVSVVLVYDSESIDESTPEEDMGGFYNPVGSALQTSGGTLTVGAGIYESGPDADNQTKTYTTGTEVTLFSRGDDRTAAYPEAGTSATNLPILQGKAVGTDEFVYDYYFQEKPSDVNALIEADTYLIYTEEKNAYIPTEGENAGKLIVNAEEVTGEEGTTTTVSGDEFFVPCNVASCDFYYYYPVADTESTVGSGDQTQTVQTYAVVYGYNEVKSLAQTENETLTDANGREADNVLVWPYAAIRSEAGSAYARGGEFYTYFGTVNTYGIYSSGGIMTVGGEASVAPEFSAQGLGTCIYMAADETAEDSDNILTIDSGTFSSEIGDTIKMFGGEMNVKAGTFTKSGDSTDNSTKTAIIHMTGGALTAAGSADASGKKSIQMTCAASTGGSTLSNVFGVYSEGGTVELQNTQINVNGTYSAGVLAVTDGQAMSADEYAVTFADSAIEVNFNESALSSSGISTEGGNIQLEGDVSVFSQGLGITARTGSINIASGTAAVTTQRGTGVYVNNGTLTVNEKATLSVKPTMSENSWVNPPGVSGDVVTHYDGVVVEGGSLVSNGTLNVEFVGVENDAYGSGENVGLTANTAYRDFKIKSYAVRVEGGKGTSVLINEGTITNDKGGGLYVNSSDSWSIGEQNIKDLTFEGISAQDATKVELKAVDISTTGTGTVSTKNIQSNWDYNLYTKGGPAVKVNQGVLRIADGTYTAKSGDGIRVQGGVAFVEGGYFVGRDYTGGDSDAYLPGAGASYAFKVFGGHAKVTGGVFGRISENETERQGNGAFVMGGTAYITKADIQAGGTTAFSVWTNANVTFNGTNEDIQVIGDSTGLAIETGGTSPVLSVTINGGTFKGTDENNTNTNGVWYGNSNAKLTIINGYFEGARRSGLLFGVVPNENNVQLSGGTYYGPDNSVYWEDRFDYGNYITTNAIAGESNLSYRTIASGCSVVGYTELGDNFSVDGARVDEDYTRSANLSNLHDKGTVTLRIDWGVIGYEVDLVFSRIEIMQQ